LETGVIGPTPAQWAASAACWLGLLPTGARWLRVAQREHYLPGATVRFARRWWVSVRENAPLAALCVLCAGLSWWIPLVGLGSAAVALGPRGLPVRGRTSPLGLTRRLRTLAAVWVVLEAAVVVAGVLSGHPAFASAIAILIVPALVDLGCLVVQPLERHLASRHVARAARRLQVVRPTIVGITGSYGKTSTKNYVAHLVRSSRSVVASPASFNNRAGLARAVNEHLVDGTEVFVAEMGTYGYGEIEELCRWCPPEISVITAIGPVHLERFGSEDAILEAKSEIIATASVAVLNVDDQRLSKLAAELEATSQRRVVRCSNQDRHADIFVGAGPDGLEVLIRGVPLGPPLSPITTGVHPTNLACAIGVAVELGVAHEQLRDRITNLPSVPHRVATATSPSGVWVIDDTFNSNPAGARAALDLLERSPDGGRRVVITPGMIELGPRQFDENRRFARAVVERGFDLIVVGRTNRAALLGGAGKGVLCVRTREEAVRWVRERLSAGDAVLYENDLPDHYP